MQINTFLNTLSPPEVLADFERLEEFVCWLALFLGNVGAGIFSTYPAPVIAVPAGKLVFLSVVHRFTSCIYDAYRAS